MNSGVRHAVKVEGYLAVVNREATEFHPFSNLSPYAANRFWDDADIPASKLMRVAVHQHGARAAVMVHNGHHANNLFTRAQPIAPTPNSVPACRPGWITFISLAGTG